MRIHGGCFALNPPSPPPLLRCSPPSSLYPFRRTPLGFPKTSISRRPHPHLRPFSYRARCVLSGSREPSPRSKETELELLDKPSPPPSSAAAPDTADDGGEEEPQKPPPVDLEDALAPFLRFFKSKDGSSAFAELEGSSSMEESDVETNIAAGAAADGSDDEEAKKKVHVRYYEPKPGDYVVGVVVSGNESRLDVNVGADMLGTMLTKEVLPLYEAELSYLLCDSENDGAAEFAVSGKMGILKDEEALSEGKKVPGKPVVEAGTVLFAEVLGRTLSGRPLLSTRMMFRRVAWHRVRQIKQLNEPIEVKIFEWNTGGLLTRIEGLRAFLPKVELMDKIRSFTDLKDHVGRKMYVTISRIDEATNDLIVSEKDAWDMMYLKEGTLLEGTVRKNFPYGAQIKIGETNRSGLLHISNITRARVSAVSDILKVDEKVKVLVVKSMFPDKISLSIADLESEPGLFLSDKEKVFSDAEEMSRNYRRRLPVVSTSRQVDAQHSDVLPFDDEASFYANWTWFRFEQHAEIEDSNNSV